MDHNSIDLTSEWYFASDNEDECIAKCREEVNNIILKSSTSSCAFEDGYIDQSFPPISKSWSLPPEQDSETAQNFPTQWKRLKDILGDEFILMENGESLWRIYQGNLYNQYLIGALEMLALRPTLIRRIFVVWDHIFGVYGLRLYKNGQWIYVIIDDFVSFIF
eukprot:GHVL01028269.1.p1 GENE.GHVL01028269.1~~GHVL01028269.1.p1  ORF type:complete len:163 (-),score=32.86 GHVL01028269.1:536-1024(-)